MDTHEHRLYATSTMTARAEQLMAASQSIPSSTSDEQLNSESARIEDAVAERIFGLEARHIHQQGHFLKSVAINTLGSRPKTQNKV